VVNKNNLKLKKAQGMKSKISPASSFRKKAQMKIQQMSFMLLGVFLFFVLVGMIILSVSFSGLKRSATDLQAQNAFLLVTKLANSPEFSCGDSYGNQKTDCVDEDKVMALKASIGNYKDFWGVTNIEIRKIYPTTLPYKEILCTTASYPAYLNGTSCNYINLMNKPASGNDESNFVALCRKEKYKEEIVNKCEMALLIIRYGGVQ
jgi:hypothetical protein